MIYIIVEISDQGHGQDTGGTVDEMENGKAVVMMHSKPDSTLLVFLFRSELEASPLFERRRHATPFRDTDILAHLSR